MKFSTAVVLLSLTTTVTAFTAHLSPAHVRTGITSPSITPLFGYLDDLNKELYQEADNPDIEGEKKENTDMAKGSVDRLGPGDWSSYVEFDEFDGGDGQMGVAGDGNKGLEKFGDSVSPAMAKSKSMSAKNAWGTSTGYADTLREQGVETSRAQQLENWANQQEVLQKKNAQKAMTESFDAVADVGEEDWRQLSKFGIERNEEFDLDESFGAVTTTDAELEGTIDLHAPMGQNAIYEFSLKNEFMGFADFRARFTDDTNPMDWSITPAEGSLSSRDVTDFILRFRPNRPGTVEGYLVVETEDFKKTWKLTGATA